MKTKLTLCFLTFALLVPACSRSSSTAGSSALKPIDQAALQTMVETTAKELLVPGAVVLLRTPLTRPAPIPILGSRRIPRR
jgi:hypothetical protein